MPIKKRKRKNTIALLLLPALIFIFFMGWSMYWIGDQKRPRRVNRKAPEKENVTFLPAVFEETKQTAN
ncbi:MAG: hypothetical protein ABSF44_01000 [Candidatus Bathyarchaeia archaeon]